MEFIDGQLSSEEKINKRAIYYHHKDKDIESTTELDSYIGEICQILHVRRADLNIVKIR